MPDDVANGRLPVSGTGSPSGFSNVDVARKAIYAAVCGIDVRRAGALAA
jgi:hypothetical protein